MIHINFALITVSVSSSQEQLTFLSVSIIMLTLMFAQQSEVLAIGLMMS